MEEIPKPSTKDPQVEAVGTQLPPCSGNDGPTSEEAPKSGFPNPKPVGAEQPVGSGSDDGPVNPAFD